MTGSQAPPRHDPMTDRDEQAPPRYTAALRRRKLLLVGGALVGVSLGLLFPLPTSELPPTADARFFLGTDGGYAATAVIGVPPLTGSETATSTIAFYSESAEVLAATAQAIQLVGPPRQVQDALSFTPQPKVGTVAVVGTATSPDEAVRLVNEFMAALTGYVAQLGVAANAQTLAAAKARVDALQAQIVEIGGRIDEALGPDPVLPLPRDPQTVELQAQRDAVVAAYGAAYQAYSALAAGATPVSPSALVVVQPASLDYVMPVGGSLLRFVSRGLVVVLLLVLGLVAASMIALALAHFDRRLRGHAATEAAFGVPVLAEIPKHRLSGDARDVMVVTEPASAAAESYRLLRSLLSIGPLASPGTSLGPEPLTLGMNDPTLTAFPRLSSILSPTVRRSRPPEHNSRRILVVTSPGSERSRSCAVANLAASFAETGQEVLVVRLTGEDGATVDDETAPRSIRDAITPSSVSHVGTLDLTTELVGEDKQPVRLLSEALIQASRYVDVVVVDAPPVLFAHGVAAVAPAADAVLVVAEAGRTTVDEAQRCMAYLRLMAAPIRGVVLTQVAGHGDWRRRLVAWRPHRTPRTEQVAA